MRSRRQCMHGTNASGAARSPLGDKVWALDVGAGHQTTHRRRGDTEEVELAKRRANLRVPFCAHDACDRKAHNGPLCPQCAGQERKNCPGCNLTPPGA